MRRGRENPSLYRETLKPVEGGCLRDDSIGAGVYRLPTTRELTVERRVNFFFTKDAVLRLIVAANHPHQIGAIALGAIGTDLEPDRTTGRHAPGVRVAEYLLHVVSVPVLPDALCQVFACYGFPAPLEDLELSPAAP